MERTLGAPREGINPVNDNERRKYGILGQHFHWELGSKVPGPVNCVGSQDARNHGVVLLRPLGSVACSGLTFVGTKCPLVLSGCCHQRKNADNTEPSHF